MVWGRESTAAYLFASSEPPGDVNFDGFHKGFDVEVQKVAFDLDASEAGDAINITQDGQCVPLKFECSLFFAKTLINFTGALLAVCTRGTERIHKLRLYDIRNKNSSAIRTIKLVSFPARIEGEVNSVAFSPDGIHLALARNDNHTHIYDSRKLDKLLFDFEHHGPCRKSPGSESFGVVHAEWVERDSKRLPVGLVTGGHDGALAIVTTEFLIISLTNQAACDSGTPLDQQKIRLMVLSLQRPILMSVFFLLETILLVNETW